MDPIPTAAPGAATPAAATPATPAKADAAAALSSDFDTFLTLLTAQIKNQDPLNPADATDYSTQLATFSGVEQSVRTNTLLEDLLGRIDGQGLGSLASWIGMEARTTGATAYEGGALTLHAAIPTFADAAEMVVTTPGGAEVARVPVDPRDETHVVTPRTAGGAPLEPGAYAFHVEPVAGTGTLQHVPAARYVTVREALVEDGRTILVLDGGVRLPSDEVAGLRPAEGAGA